MTSQLGTALRDLADAVDPGRLPSPEALRTGGDLRRRRTKVQAAAGAAIAATALAVVLITQDPSPPDPQPAEPLPSPTGAPRPEPTEGARSGTRSRPEGTVSPPTRSPRWGGRMWWSATAATLRTRGHRSTGPTTACPGRPPEARPTRST